jgi:hypothetical protein
MADAADRVRGDWICGLPQREKTAIAFSMTAYSIGNAGTYCVASNADTKAGLGRIYDAVLSHKKIGRA